MDIKIEQRWHLELTEDGCEKVEVSFKTEAEAMTWVLEFLAKSLANKKGVDE